MSVVAPVISNGARSTVVRQAIAAVVEAAGTWPVIAGCGAPSTDAATVLAIVAARHDASALLCAPPHPIPVKAALSLAGLCDAELRLPLTRATQATFELFERLLPALLVAEEEATGLPCLSLAM